MDSKLEYYQLTATGDRSMNQDCTANYVCSQYGLFVVADGLGGHKAGEKASQFFCQGLINQKNQYQPLIRGSEKQIKKACEDWIKAAIGDMKKLFANVPEAIDAHTTCVVLYLDEKITVTIHCGDSRIYRLNKKRVLWRTKDHSLVQKRLDEGSVLENQMGTHPDQNQLMRTININKLHPVEVRVYEPFKKGETFLLCTDGFWEYAKEYDLLKLAAPDCDKNELKKIARMMHLRANGKGDNLTVQWIRGL